jgi:LacI family sucrose operon transcriptional repressor
VSIDEIARLAGVSKTTVSLILNNKAEQHRISPATEQNVKRITKRMGYRPSALARGFRMKRTSTMGLIVGDVKNWFSSLLEKSIEEEARRHGFNLVIASSNDDASVEREVVADLTARSVDALIVVSVHRNNGEYRKININKTPVIFVDRRVSGPGSVCVESDNFNAARNLIRNLFRQGHRNIAFIGGIRDFPTNKDRYKGYLAAHVRSGKTPFGQLRQHGSFTPESGYHSARKLFTGHGIMPDALFTASFTLLEGVLLYLKELRKKDRPRIKIATFDDHPLLDFLPFGIDSVKQDCTVMGRSAVELALKAIKGERPLKNRIIKSTMIVRDWDENES